MGSRIVLALVVIVLLLGLGLILYSMVPHGSAQSANRDWFEAQMHGMGGELALSQDGMDKAWKLVNKDYSRPSYASNGQKIFLIGHNLQGQPISGTGLARMTARFPFGCANCHGPDGQGGVLMPDGETVSPSITWRALTSAEHDHEEMDEHGHMGGMMHHHMHHAYTEAQLGRAITRGIQPDGDPLSEWMPRWGIGTKDLSDLIGYMKTDLSPSR